MPFNFCGETQLIFWCQKHNSVMMYHSYLLFVNKPSVHISHYACTPNSTFFLFFFSGSAVEIKTMNKDESTKFVSYFLLGYFGSLAAGGALLGLFLEVLTNSSSILSAMGPSLMLLRTPINCL